MAVKRIVANVAVKQIDAAKAFYGDALGMAVVNDLSEVHRKMRAGGFHIDYGPVTEPWGVRRFYVRDPFGRLVNILEHGQ